MSAPEIRFQPINDGREEECQCARCGSSATPEDCEGCDGTGLVDAYDIPDWQDYEGPNDTICGQCLGTGGRLWRCVSSPEWCWAHPMPGRETIELGKVEWFDLPPASPNSAGETPDGAP